MDGNNRHEKARVSLLLLYILSYKGENGKITYLKHRVCKLFSKVFITSILLYPISYKIVFSMLIAQLAYKSYIPVVVSFLYFSFYYLYF